MPVLLYINGSTNYVSRYLCHIHTVSQLKRSLSLHPWGVNYHDRLPLFLLADVQDQVLVHSQGMLSNGSYVYVDHLQALSSFSIPEPQSVKDLSLEVYSPLQLHQWS